MKKILAIALILSLFAGTAMLQGQTTVKKRVAIYVTGDAENNYKKVIRSKLVSSITRSQSYTIVERAAEFLSAMDEEHDKMTSGNVRVDQIAKLGQ